MSKSNIIEQVTQRFYNDPAGFCSAFTKVFYERDGSKQVLYPKQIEFLNLIKPEENIISVVKCRQAGFSTAIQAKALHRAYFGKVPEILITSAGQNQATRVLKKIKYFFQSMPEFMQVEFEKDTDTQIRLANGTTIYSLPANPGTVRGFSGAAFLDEFGVLGRRDSDEMWEALLPCIAKGYDIVTVSTPKGKDNMFYDLCNPKLNEHGEIVGVRAKKIIKLSWWDVPHIAAVIEDFKLAMSPKQFAQEFECQFVEDQADSIFTYDFMLDNVVNEELELIDISFPVLHAEDEMPEGTSLTKIKKKYVGGIYGGWDIAITGDGSILTIFGIDENDSWNLIAYYKMPKGMDLSKQAKIVARICDYLCVRKLTYDGTSGLGISAGDNLRQTSARPLINAFRFTQVSKSSEYSEIKSKMAKQEMQMPDIPEAVKEFTFLGYNPTTGRIAAMGSNRTHHDDWPSSFLCAYAGRRKSATQPGFNYI